MSHCTNINHPQIQDWSNEFNITPEKIGAIVSLWQERNNDLEDFPSKLWMENQINSLNTSTEIKQEVNEIFEQNPELSSIGTPEQYSQYLDTIFPDSKVKEIDNYLYNNVLNQLEQENIIEKDCSGGKLKAEKGLQSNFTKGGEWKIYEIFEGKSHKQGGIDINIKNNQISFTNKNGSIKAKYGLVIPKDN